MANRNNNNNEHSDVKYTFWSICLFDYHEQYIRLYIYIIQDNNVIDNNDGSEMSTINAEIKKRSTTTKEWSICDDPKKGYPKWRERFPLFKCTMKEETWKTAE
ncbi:hypothetical protein HN011_001935 [Eciton burchellii]|nr:hypothetical protein HN011_001935 [Eciton burchellii]